MLLEKGPAYGYFPKPTKTWRISKEDKLEKAKSIFMGTGVKITSDGMRHVGAAIGSKAFKDSYVLQKIEEWVDSVGRLAKIAITRKQPFQPSSNDYKAGGFLSCELSQT